MKREFIQPLVTGLKKKRLQRDNVLVVYAADGRMQAFSSQSPPR
jgi:hypothetical protein